MVVGASPAPSNLFPGDFAAFMFDPKYLRTMALYGVIGAEVALMVVVFIGGGYLLDQVWGWTPILTVVGMVMGCTGAGYRLYQVTQRFSQDKDD